MTSITSSKNGMYVTAQPPAEMFIKGVDTTVSICSNGSEVLLEIHRSRLVAVDAKPSKKVMRSSLIC